MSSNDHAVRFYDRDATLVAEVARFVETGLGAGEAAIVIATVSHVAEVEALLAERGVDVITARRDGRYVTRDAADTLGAIAVDGEPDPRRFVRVVTDTITRAAANGTRRVRVFSEMVALLWAAGRRDAALRLEALWNELGRDLRYASLCAYPVEALDIGRESGALEALCATHSRVIPPEDHDEETSGRRDDPGAASPRASVLVVEDNFDAAESMSMLLELFGHDVRMVHDGPSALEAARASVPDVVLLDIGLPTMDGYEVARAMRADPRLRRAVLVALTGYGHPDDRARASAAGFDHHLVKPVDAQTLQRLVADAVHKLPDPSRALAP